MFIILEGPRGAGKSTIARHLYMHPDLVNAKLTHKNRPRPNATAHDEYISPIKGYTPGKPDQLNPHLICDRWHIGEMVYPTLYNRPTIMDYAEFQIIDAKINSLGALVVFIDAPATVIVKRRQYRGDQDVNVDNITNERSLFQQAFTHRSHLNMLYVTTDMIDEVYSPKDIDTLVEKSDIIDNILFSAMSNESKCLTTDENRERVF